MLDKAIATDSTLITPYFNKANCLINLNRKMEAIRTYERYLHITDNVEEIPVFCLMWVRLMTVLVTVLRLTVTTAGF